MRGVGGPLLCIGDLLSDVGEIDGGDHLEPSFLSSSSPLSPSPSLSTNPKDPPPPLELSQQFEENYNQLTEALSESGHSWTALTLKLCTALETADKLIQSANSESKLLSEKVKVLQNIVIRGDSAITALKLMNIGKKGEERTSGGS